MHCEEYRHRHLFQSSSWSLHPLLSGAGLFQDISLNLNLSKLRDVNFEAYSEIGLSFAFVQF